ncbi:MAG: carbamoyltransferase family protein [Candidatus Acidiferrales bacterium]
MNILGLSALGRDPAAALLVDGGIVAAVEEAKLARTHAIEGLPRAAIRFCLERAGTDWRNLECIAVASRPTLKWGRQALFRARLAAMSPVSSAYYLNASFGELGRDLNNFRILRRMAGGAPDRVVELDHHLCHAASAFYASPFDRALVVVLDEQGDSRTGFVGMGEGTRLRELKSVSLPHSLAWVYTQVTQFLRFVPHAEEHKTQWLSLAGEPVFSDLFLQMLRRGPGGPPHLNTRFFNRGFSGKLSFSNEFYESLRIPDASESRLDEPMRANIAASLQKACAVVVTEWFESLRSQTGASSLCLAGGLFVNPLLVAAVESRTGFSQTFVQPAAGNEGTSVGAAWLMWHQIMNRPRIEPMSSLYWGPTNSSQEIKAVLDNCKLPYRYCNTEDHQIEETLRLLESGKIVAWFQGPTEFGRRALGHRSLLASPWASYVRENLNDYVKHREPFRPFALSIPEDACAEYFECSTNGRFMTSMATANEKGRKLLEGLPEGFLLKDNLVRLHIVTAEANPLFHKLLKRSGEKGAAPILVNTSFNLFGEPLVVTPRDAVRSYFCSGADALLIGNFLLTKR